MDICIPPDTDWSCRYSDEDLEAAREDPEQRAKLERAEAFAWSVLAALTAYQIGTCPISVRPCAARALPEGSFRAAPVRSAGFVGGAIGRPFISGGNWYNACPCASSSDCGCQALSEVILPAPAGRITSVRVDGITLDRKDYRVDNGNRLVRLDGESWPSSQDLSAPATEPGTFEVSYYRGSAPNTLTRAAAGVLAAEFLAACEGNECRLPWSVTNVSQGGVSYEMQPSDFPEGKTGIPEVDAVIRIYNPYGLRQRPTVASPDSYSTRIPTWQTR